MPKRQGDAVEQIAVATCDAVLPAAGLGAASPDVSALRRSLPYVLSVLGAVLVWSTSFVITKTVLTEIPPWTLGTIRTLIAAVILGVAFALQRSKQRPTWSDTGMMALGGFVGITVYYALENTGLQLATAADAALIVASFPAIQLLLEIIVDRTRVTPVHLAGIAIMIVGVGLIVRENSTLPASGRFTGDLILAGTGFVWAAYNYATRGVQRRYTTLTVVFYQTVAGALAFVPLALVERSQWRIPSVESMVSVAYLSVFCSVLAYVWYAYGLRGMRSSTAVTLLNLIPVFGLVLAIVVLGETETMVQLAGGAIVIVGVILCMREASHGGAPTENTRF